MIDFKIDENKLDEIRSYIVENIIQNTDLMFNDEIRSNKMPVDTIEVIVDLYEYLHVIVTGDKYDYMFHWANKIGADIETGLLDEYVTKQLKEGE